ncbi:MAG: DUF2281 domain-containing protein [Acidobacteriota bacterium]|nr:DUF2281 domain-containing protein [Acidobacteriota bacterium]
MQVETLVEKIKSLPPEKINEVEDFVDFIAERNSRSARHEAIAAYAAEYGGINADLDPELEAASLELLHAEEKVSQ